MPSSFGWLDQFYQAQQKSADYAEKTLAAYRLGMKAKGAIVGVRIERDSAGCEACQQLDPNALYSPDDAPHLPLPNCSKGLACRCVYRPMMRYEQGETEE